MDKLQMQSKNLVDENIEFIAKRFPNCVTEALDEEGKLTKLVDFDMLKQELSHVVIDGDKERYTMTWPDKKQAILTANAPIAKTLRPCREESVDFDHTQNLYIEGDNLDVLKLLRETYLGKIKVIYIDPPYNTGNDFVYNDDFAVDTDEYLERSNQIDEQGNRMVVNNDSNGRFHTDWLNMMYSRLKVAKDLLADDGFIFVSIDENEQCNLEKLLNEIFGSYNYISNCFVLDNLKGKTNDNFITSVGSRLYVFAKNKQCTLNDGFNTIENVFAEKIEEKYKDEDEIGVYNKITFKKTGQAKNREDRPFMFYPILQKNGQLYSITVDEFNKLYDKNSGKFDDKFLFELKDKYKDYEFILPLDSNGDYLRWTSGFNTFLQKMNNDIYYDNGVKQKSRPEANELLQIYASGTPKSLLYKTSYSNGTENLKKLFKEAVFDFPKPLQLLLDLLKMPKNNDGIVLDFFSGSATTAHAVMQLNAEDDGTRKFIMVQLPENCDSNSEPYKAGYKNICEIGKERIRRAGKNIKDENPGKKIDVGFRVFKLDSSCMKDIYYSPNKMTQDLLTQFEDNIKEDRTSEDLLFQVMLDMGVLLSSEIKTLEINGKKVFNVNDGDLVCCFDKDLNETTVTAIAKMQPLYAVFRDASMSTDSVAVNFDQIFETYSPTTTRKVI